MNISPNPANGNVRIELKETQLGIEEKDILIKNNKSNKMYQEISFDTPPQRIRIFDVKGIEKLCFEGLPSDNIYQLEIGHLNPGVYAIHLEHSNGTVIRQLLVD